MSVVSCWSGRSGCYPCRLYPLQVSLVQAWRLHRLPSYVSFFLRLLLFFFAFGFALLLPLVLLGLGWFFKGTCRRIVFGVFLFLRQNPPPLATAHVAGVGFRL